MKPRTAVTLAACCLATLLAAEEAAACSCLEPGPPAEALQQADAVFAGRVVAVERADQEVAGHHLQRRKVTLDVATVWKGCGDGEPLAEARRVVLWTGLGGGDCGYDFEPDASYLVYAYAAGDGEERFLTTGICSRTRRVEAAGDDLAALGAPKRSVEPNSE